MDNTAGNQFFPPALYIHDPARKRQSKIPFTVFESMNRNETPVHINLKSTTGHRHIGARFTHKAIEETWRKPAWFAYINPTAL